MRAQASTLETNFGFHIENRNSSKKADIYFSIFLK